jgi:hypothetical protein
MSRMTRWSRWRRKITCLSRLTFGSIKINILSLPSIYLFELPFLIEFLSDFVLELNLACMMIRLSMIS